MKNTILFVVIAALFLSCSSFVYYPNGANAPLLTQKDDVQIAVGIKGFGGDIRSAYAVRRESETTGRYENQNKSHHH